MANPAKLVVVPIECHHCKNGIEIEYQVVLGFSCGSFYQIVCPHCGRSNHQDLPGEILAVFKEGDRGDSH